MRYQNVVIVDVAKRGTHTVSIYWVKFDAADRTLGCSRPMWLESPVLTAFLVLGVLFITRWRDGCSSIPYTELAMLVAKEEKILRL